VSIEHAQRLTGCATSQRTLLTTSHSLCSSRLGEEKRRKEDSVHVEVDCNNVCLWRTRYDSTKTPRLPDGSPCSRPQPSPHLEASSVASTQSRFGIVTDTHLRNLIHHATYPSPSIVSRVEHDCDHIGIANTFCDTPPTGLPTSRLTSLDLFHRAHRPLRTDCRETSYQNTLQSILWQKSAHCRKGGTLCWMTIMRLNVRRDRR